MNLTKAFIVLFGLICLNSCHDEKGGEKKLLVTKGKEMAKLPYFNSALFTPDWKNNTHKIPSFSFTNQEGEEVTNKTFEGKIYITDFFFTICPGICTKLTANMGTLRDAYQEDPDIMLLSHTVMPWNDTVDKLAEYAQEHNVSLPKWNLVTGDKDAIYDIARNGYFADEDFIKTQKEEDFIHTENFILVDKEGYIRGVYNGTLAFDVKRLMRHIAILKQEY